MPDRPPPATTRLSFPPEARLLGTVRLVVGIVARKAMVDEEGVEDLKVAVSETCAVAIGDLNRVGLDIPIELDLVEDVDRFGVEVRDRVPDTGAHGDDVAGLDDRQFGLALVGALVDDLTTGTRVGGGHHTSFWLHRPSTGPPPPRT